MLRFPKKFVAPLLAVAVVGGLALVGSSIGSTAATPTPDAAAPANDAAVASWQAFQAHLGSSLPVLETDINTLANGGAAGYVTATSSGVDAARVDALDEVAWLKANPAAPCYAAVYGDYLSVNQTLATAMTDAGRGDYATANTLIEQLNASLTKLATDTPKIAC
jgi:hypothetical protein